MPCDDPAVMRWLTEQLIVPETHCAAEQLRRRHQKRRIPQQVMKARRDSPRAQRMKQNGRRIGRFVRVKLVEEIVAGMIEIDQASEFVAKRFNLFVIQHAY